jgi:NAD-dependent deacetylase
VTRIARVTGERADIGALRAAAGVLAKARHVVALTGAGMSVESGIPDFRSPGGLWRIFDPMEYATLSCFLSDPDKAWRLYRALGASLMGKAPHDGHVALANLEAAGLMAGVVTQNIDGLHQRAGSGVVIELHGDGRRAECLRCGRLEPFSPHWLEPGPVPRCPDCGSAFKPNVVLFEEPVRGLDAVHALIEGCDLMLVIGTSAQVAPASLLPDQVVSRGGSVLEVNLEKTELTRGGLGPEGFLLLGPAGAVLPPLVEQAVLIRRERP